MKRLRKVFYIGLVLTAVAGLIYTMSLDSSTPTVAPEEDVDQTATETVSQGGEETVVSRFEQLVYGVGDTQLQFVLGDEDQWIWLDDTSFPLDDALIAHLVEALETLSYQRAVPFSDTVLPADYGLENPWATLTATRTDETTLTLDIGAQGTDGGYYMIKDGDTERALVYQADWVETLFEPIYNMMELPQLPELTADSIQEVIVAQGEGALALYIDQDDNGVAGWYVSGSDTQADLPDLMDTLSGVSLVKCFSFDPSAGAVTICGFDEPEVNISILYGEAKDESQVLSLHIGTLSNDPAYRYVRVNEDTTIYLMEETWVNAVLSLVDLV